MKHLKYQYNNKLIFHLNFNKLVITVLLFNIINYCSAQECPPNIDFEQGNFNQWKCYIGDVEVGPNSTNNITLVSANGPVQDRHTMYGGASAINLKDYYGNFPVLCPNGSNYSIKLGNNLGGAEADGLSYDFIIPSGRNTFSLVYNYAVVFQDPNHLKHQQPRLELEIINITDSVKIQCSSFEFIPNGSALPGFYLSARSDSTPVWCKDWSAVTVNLNGLAGKKIRMFFKTADCTFNRHFGYAYLDINTECSSEFIGAAFCKDDTAVNLIAPYGYKNYTWYNSSFSNILGIGQQIKFVPPPQSGMSIAVEITPFSGYGCIDTLYTRLYDTLKLIANAGKDIASCNGEEVQIGDIPKSGVNYHWVPELGLSNVNISNPRVNIDTTTEFILRISNSGGGCINYDTVKVIASNIDTSLILLGKSLFCKASTDSALLYVNLTDSIQWFKDDFPIVNNYSPNYLVKETGKYFATLYTKYGCLAQTRDQFVTIETPVQGIRYPLKYAVKNLPITLDARTFGKAILWNPLMNLTAGNTVTPVFNASFENDYLYNVEITSNADCLTIDTQVVRVIKEIKVFVPTAFTPNNDGLNDFLKPTFIGFKKFSYFKIFNRLGQLVFDLQNHQQGWNGKLNNTIQPTGTYVWMFQALGVDDKLYNEKGVSVLIR